MIDTFVFTKLPVLSSALMEIRREKLDLGFARTNYQ